MLLFVPQLCEYNTHVGQWLSQCLLSALLTHFRFNGEANICALCSAAAAAAGSDCDCERTSFIQRLRFSCRVFHFVSNARTVRTCVRLEEELKLKQKQKRNRSRKATVNWTARSTNFSLRSRRHRRLTPSPLTLNRRPPKEGNRPQNIRNN